jgi:hypothetical protein
MVRWAKGVGCTCTLFALSTSLARADQTAGPKQECLAASDLGQNERDEGHYRAARRAFATCARDICPRVVADLCTKWLHDIGEIAPTIVLGAKDEHGSDLTDVKVTLDGAPFATVLEGRPVEADTGAHVLRFERDGSEPVEQQVTLHVAERARLVTVTLRSITATAPSSPTETATLESSSPSQTPIASLQYVTAASIGLAAVAAAGTGVYFLVQSNQRSDEAAGLRAHLAQNACLNVTSATCQLLSDKVHTQHDDATVATTLFIGAGVLAAGAAATWFLWPGTRGRQAQTTAWIVPTQGGLTLEVAASLR